MVAISPISLFSNVTKRWCLCPFPLKYGWACNSYSVEAAEWDHTTSKAKSETAVQRLPCSLYWSHWSPQLHWGRHAGREPRHTERPYVGAPADRSVFKASQGSDMWAKEPSGCSSPQLLSHPQTSSLPSWGVRCDEEKPSCPCSDLSKFLTHKTCKHSKTTVALCQKFTMVCNTAVATKPQDMLVAEKSKTL